MKRHVGIIVIGALVVVVLLLNTVAFTVDSTQHGLVKRFGRTVRVINGRDEAGLKLKWIYPIEQLATYDARTFVFEDTHLPISTRNKHNLLVTMFCAWRIADPQQFQGRMKTIAAAEARVRSLLRDYKQRVMGAHDMEDFVNTDADRMVLPRIEEKILQEVRRETEEPYGVKICMVGIKSLGLPEEITKTVIEAMKEERQSYVRSYESAGAAQATAIRERARAAQRQIIEFAERKADEIESEGIRAAAEQYEKFAENEALAMFLRWLESLKIQLRTKAVFLLDPSTLWGIRYFRDGASMPPPKPPVDFGARPREDQPKE